MCPDPSSSCKGCDSETTITHTSLSSSEYEAMWLNQRMVWRNLAGRGPPTAPNTATSACDGTYLKKHDGRVDNKTRGRKGGGENKHKCLTYPSM